MNPDTPYRSDEREMKEGSLKEEDSPPSTRTASLLLRAALNITNVKNTDSHPDASLNANTNASSYTNTSANNTIRNTNSAIENKVKQISPELYAQIIKAYNITKNPKTDAAMLSRFSEVLKKINKDFHYKLYGFVSFKLFVMEVLTDFETFSIAPDYFIRLKSLNKDKSALKSISSDVNVMKSISNDVNVLKSNSVDSNTFERSSKPVTKVELNSSNSKLSSSLQNHIQNAFDMTFINTINMAPLSRFSEELKKLDASFHYKEYNCLTFKAFVKNYLANEFLIEEHKTLAYIKVRSQGVGKGNINVYGCV